MELTDARREEVGDGQLILAAYARWGEECVDHLDGDFAFAIWDERRRRLFCARDHFGIKPFYYCFQQGAFLFASEIKGILAGGIAGIPNDAYLAGYLLVLFDDAEATAYRGILRLPAAHSLTVSADGVVLRRYWRLRAGPELRLRSDAEYAEVFRAEFAAAVRSRLRSAFPVGTLLSGGMDSSSITCMARQLLAEEGGNRQLHAFSATFDSSPSCDERQYFTAVTAQEGIIAHLTPVDQLGPFTAYHEGQALQDEPYVGTTHYLHWGLYQAARPHVRTLLEGHGGDSVVSHGMTYLTELTARGRWVSLLREARAYAGKGGWRLRDVLWEWSVLPLIPGPLRSYWRRLHDERTREQKLARALIAPAVIERLRLRQRLDAARRADLPARSVREEQEVELASPIYALIFEWFNIAAHTHALDVRYPFFDRRFVEFCLTLPPEQKLRGGWTRYILRRAMEGILPAEVQWRAGKANLSPCFFRNLRARDQQLLGRMLDEGREKLAPYLDTARLQDCYRRWAAEEPSAQRYWEPIWFAATLAAWMLDRDVGEARSHRDA